MSTHLSVAVRRGSFGRCDPRGTLSTLRGSPVPPSSVHFRRQLTGRNACAMARTAAGEQSAHSVHLQHSFVCVCVCVVVCVFVCVFVDLLVCVSVARRFAFGFRLETLKSSIQSLHTVSEKGAYGRFPLSAISA